MMIFRPLSVNRSNILPPSFVATRRNRRNSSKSLPLFYRSGYCLSSPSFGSSPHAPEIYRSRVTASVRGERSFVDKKTDLPIQSDPTSIRRPGASPPRGAETHEDDRHPHQAQVPRRQAHPHRPRRLASRAQERGGV